MRVLGLPGGSGVRMLGGGMGRTPIPGVPVLPTIPRVLPRGIRWPAGKWCTADEIKCEKDRLLRSCCMLGRLGPSHDVGRCTDENFAREARRRCGIREWLGAE